MNGVLMGVVNSTREERRLFWVGYLGGATVKEAAGRVGRDESAGVKWLHHAGGMRPENLAPPSGARLSVAEREEILIGLELGESIRAIAGRIGRAPSTVQRELRRNMTQHYRTQAVLRRRGGRPRSRPWDYRPHRAQQRADRQARRVSAAKLATNQRLRAEVQARLERRESPEQITQRLKMDFPDDPEMRVSHETIYQALYVQSRGALRRELTTSLRTGRTIRKPRRRAEERRGRLRGMVMISERPPEVADRAVPGHWEGDLILGSTASGSAVGTLVERSTRFVMLLHLPGGHTAEIVQEAMVAKMATLPEQLRRSLTWDQGSEMANHVQIAEATGLSIYFCDPHSPWQRGTNENTNGLLRQYLPKGTDLSFYGPGMLDNIAAELNNRPRKTLNWHTPTEALHAILSGQEIQTVLR
jgi:IS30 family transposase